jgi:flagellar protein FlbD
LVVVNSDQIETVEQNPDTVVTLISGNRLTVQETPERIAELVRVFRRSLYCRRRRPNDRELTRLQDG